MIKKELIELNKKLVRFKTISSNKSELERCIRFIENYFNINNLFKKIFYSNGIPSLLVSNSLSKNPDLLLNGHIDVVEGNNNQFKPFVKNDKLYGRGTIDMKSSIAVIMLIMKKLKSTNKKISAMFVSDEEIFGKDGTKYILNKGYKPKFTIITEESNFDIVIKQKGQLTLKLEAKGKSGHGSQPWTGLNAIEELIEIYQKIRNLFPKEQKNTWNINSINLGIINGGVAPNVIPSKAELILDIRYPTNLKLDSFLVRFYGILRKSSVTYSLLTKTNPMDSGNAIFFINKLKPIVEKQIKRKAKLKWTNYCSDGRYFSDSKLPVIEFGPTGANYHTDNEYVDINSLVNYYEILKRFIIS
ncbi:MAG: Succinyl-diaminopimelate desuccinylase [Candidatus Roizmanbacteria bacterium GW2011_GWC2_37_13]|uniref:Succinyl-diaminopimelate desuccinylase n=1 Tax=Candidatus Roizmanbacteria bacterium GW2011_GWC2_37_13 TaxID=1618486 RepID=A0A0G0JED4_9BACT|nr:MAG: Succinyl-diaminopimelate desuccinylase [Candidatus Roizmanbacteria bacterium GW2011_GWC1_37_12]KKQ26531.1 MAG: Succinyl-diaminopimelate desuccinylase [Candidatus Roizmanbacteria bacterium GW2011_GWC2_37_13]